MAKKQLLSMGPGTCQINLDLYAQNRNRLVEVLRKKTFNKCAVVLQGGEKVRHYDTDTYYPFRQESYFQWAFGVVEPGFSGVIDIESGQGYLFMPRRSDNSINLSGPDLALEYFTKKYDVTQTFHIEDLNRFLKSLNPSCILTLKGRNTDSGVVSKEASFPGKEHYKINNEVLHQTMSKLRVFKTVFEYDVMKYVAEVTSIAHKRVMRLAKVGKSEYLCECEFLNYVYGAGGCKFEAGLVTCASGSNTSYKEYWKNSGFIRDGDLCVFTMGTSYFGYSSVISCTFPASGKFTPEQRVIYEAVLASNRAVLMQAKPGVSWVDMHILGNRLLLQKLKDGGLIKGEISEMIKNGLAAVFQPHGIGHLIGLDRHDVGGFSEGTPPRSNHDDSTARLRTARILEEGMFFTVGPACYFIDGLLERAGNDATLSKFLVPDMIQKYQHFGGVRIMDVIYIHASGAFSVSKVPRTVEQIEDWLAGIDDYELLQPHLLNKRVSSVRFFT